MQIFGIKIDSVSRIELLEKIKFFLGEKHFHRIATVNPEFLLLAEKDAHFRSALLQADVCIADGFGIVLAGLLHGQYIHRFPGADLMEEILHIANEQKLSVYLAVRADGLSTYEEVRVAILRKYPHLRISGANIDVENFRNCLSSSEKEKSPACRRGKEIGNSAIILCNFGVPTQESFLAQLKADSYPLRLAMGVGGSFDYLTGRIKRAPMWMRTIGLEWLWRLIQQPKRWKRIWYAVVVFPFRAIFATIEK